MDRPLFEIQIPGKDFRLDQDEEWIILHSEGHDEKIYLHDYARLYKIPDLYEEVIHKRLKCSSPQVVCSLLKKELEKEGKGLIKLRILDFGAGNGMVGECLQEEIGCDALIGVDIIPEALEAALRDRPGTYDHYYLMDLNQPNASEEMQLNAWNFNVLITVGALGFKDIPTRAFINAFNIIEDDALVAFNVKDKFFSEDDKSEFRSLLDFMMKESLELLQKKRYCHRLSVSGEELYYYAIVAKKLKQSGSIRGKN